MKKGSKNNDGLWWQQLTSPVVIVQVKKLVELVLDTLEKQGINRLTVTKIPFTHPSNLIGIESNEALVLLERLGLHGRLFSVLNRQLSTELRYAHVRDQEIWAKEIGSHEADDKLSAMSIMFNISEDDLNNFALLQVRTSETVLELEKVKEGLVSKLGNYSHVPEIYYNKQSGDGYANNKKFKFKNHRPEYKIFAEPYDGLSNKNLNSTVSRERVLVLMESYKEGEKQADDSEAKTGDTLEINELTKTIREKTGLNTEQLSINNGSLTLFGKKLDSSPRKKN